MVEAMEVIVLLAQEGELSSSGCVFGFRRFIEVELVYGRKEIK